MTPTVPVDASKLEVMRFEAELGAAVKRYDPYDFACAVAAQLKSVLDRSGNPAHFRPHDLMHSLRLTPPTTGKVGVIL